ncbi:hypothetical protein D3C72_2202590 [compost metagenome]
MKFHVRDRQSIHDLGRANDLFVRFARTSKDQMNAQIHFRAGSNLVNRFDRSFSRVASTHEFELIIKEALNP